GGEAHVHAGRYARPQFVEGNVDAGRVDLRAARALESWRTRELADDRDHVAGGRPERQDLLVVLQQYGALGGRGPGQFVVSVDVEARGGWLNAVDEPQHAEHCFIEDGFVQGSPAYGVHDGGVADSEVRRHLQVQP